MTAILPSSSLLRHTVIIVPLAALFYLVVTNYSTDSDGPIIRISTGFIQGKPGISRDGGEFYEFLGIPYASPPIGSLRFEPPQAPKPWTRIKQTIRYGPKCSQLEFFSSKILGQEACLTLNVFTPKTRLQDAFTSGENVGAPVMVFIHGGYFMSGSSDAYRPEYFMDPEVDVVLVTINYRVGSLGFLNVENGNITGARGNMGMKDQVMALRWVQQNIQVFGGNPNEVTLFGCSAGASAVHFHILSKLSSGLFHKAISQSGSAIKPFSFSNQPKEQAYSFGEKLGCPTNDSELLVDCLKTTDVDKLMEAHRNYLEIFLDPLSIFAPSIEPVDDETTFLSRYPLQILMDGEQNNVPWITGLNSDEGLLFTARMLKKPSAIAKVNQDWQTAAASLLDLNSNNGNNSELLINIRDFYFGSSVNFLKQFQNFTDMLSDRLYNYATKEAALLHAQKNHVYLYYYTYPSEFSFSSVLTLSGKLPAIIELSFNLLARWVTENIFGNEKSDLAKKVAHGDELLMLFMMDYISNIRFGHKDYNVSKSIVKLWSEFAHSNESSSHLPFSHGEWKPLSLDRPLEFLNIDTNARLIDEPFQERLEFWKSLQL